MDEKTMNIIKERLEQITQERDRFLQNANQQLVAYTAVIDELKRLLGAPVDSPKEPPKEPPKKK